MKHRLNLFTPDLAPKLDLLSLNSVVGFCAAVALLLTLTWAGLAWQGDGLSSQLNVLQSEQRQLQADVDKLQMAMQNRKPDPVLEQKVASKQKMLERQQRLLQEFAQREVIKTQGFAPLLTDLANQSSGDLWLNSIEIDELNMLLDGEVTKPEAFPQWLQRLAQTRTFTGKTFDTARVFRDNDVLRFELKTERAEESDEQGAGGE